MLVTSHNILRFLYLNVIDFPGQDPGLIILRIIKTRFFLFLFFCFFVFCFFLVLWVHPELVCFSLSNHLSLLITSDEFSQLLFEPTFIFQEYFH